jgi:hypothetical protein
MCQELEKLSNKCEPKDLSATMPDLLCWPEQKSDCCFTFVF